MGMGALALGNILAEQGFSARRHVRLTPVTGPGRGRAFRLGAVNPLLPKASPLPARAKQVIHLFMNGGPSHVDTFDPKPTLDI